MIIKDKQKKTIFIKMKKTTTRKNEKKVSDVCVNECDHYLLPNNLCLGQPFSLNSGQSVLPIKTKTAK